MNFATSLRTTLGAAAFLASSVAMAAAVPTNTGWVFDELTASGSPTTGSPWTFSLAAGETASFKVTDSFALGDSFTLFSGTTLLATSSAFAGAANAIVGDSNGEAGWLSASYEKFEYIFSGAGSYSFSIVGDGAGGVPAGLYLRLDVTRGSVPEPTSLALVALALLGAGTVARRRS